MAIRFLEEETTPAPGTRIRFVEESTPTATTTAPRLTSLERFTTGFAPNPPAEVARMRAERGVAPGTPLEPVGFNLENFLDLPNDLLDLVGPALPALGQFIAAVPTAVATKSPALAIRAGAVGAGAGEALRQALGAGAGFQAPVGSRVGRVALETGVGGAGELGGLALNALFKATKRGLVQAFEQVSKFRGVDKAVEVFGQLAPNMAPKLTRFAQSALKRGDDRVLSEHLASPAFPFEFSERVLFGGHDDPIKMAAHLATVAATNRASPLAVELLGETYLGADKALLRHIIQRGGRLNPEAASDPFILTLATRINEGMLHAKGVFGRDVAKARLALVKKAGNVDVDLSDANELLVRLLPAELVESVGNTVRINPRFAATPTGRQQVRVFGEMFSRFFGEADPSAAFASLKGPDVAQAMMRGIRDLRSTRHVVKFTAFNSRLTSLERQLSGREFAALGEMGQTLQQYLAALRGRVTQVAQSIGDESLMQANARFAHIAGLQEQLGIEVAHGNAKSAELLLRNLLGRDPTHVRQFSAEGLDAVLQQFGRGFLRDLRDFDALKTLGRFSEHPIRSQATQKLVSDMANPFQDSPASDTAWRLIDTFIDPGLPKALQIGDAARTHVVAKALDQGAFGLLRARFLSSGLGLPAIAGGLTGGAVLGPLGGMAGLVAGLVLQQPKLFRALLQRTAPLSFQELRTLASHAKARVPEMAFPRRGGAVLAQLLRAGADADAP